MSQSEDTPKPQRKLYRRFLVPEESITMKVLFENIKNYTVCAVILVAISSLINRTSLPIVMFEPTLNSIGITALIGTGVALGLLLATSGIPEVASIIKQ